MEFKYRAFDQRPRTDLPPYPWNCSLSQPALLGSFSKDDPTSWTRSNLWSIPPNEAEKIQRELEKQQIRRDIIASEIARRQILEAEVRMELMVEREMASQRTAAQVFPSNNQFRMSPEMYPFDYGPLKELSPFSDPTIFNRSLSFLPQHQVLPPLQPCPTPSEIIPPTVANKDKLIVLARPDPKISCPKQKAVTHPAAVDSGAAQSDLKRKPGEELSCALCHITVFNERDFNAHIQGKKHKAKTNELRTHSKPNTILLAKESRRKATLAANRLENLDLGTDSFRLNIKPREEWTCALCQVSTTGKKLLEAHIQGKKHKTKERQLLAGKNSNEKPRQEVIGISSKGNEETGTTNVSETLWYGDSLQPKQKEDMKIDSNEQSDAVMGVNVKNEAKMKMKFWCEMCKVGADSFKVMLSHERGRKHMAQMKHANPPNETTYNVMQGATDASGNEKAI